VLFVNEIFAFLFLQTLLVESTVNFVTYLILFIY